MQPQCTQPLETPVNLPINDEYDGRVTAFLETF